MRVSALWRYPVKSMAGESADNLDLDRQRPRGDRLWALHDVERDVTVTARRLAGVLLCSARYASQPTIDSGPGNVPPVIITLPDGAEVPSGDPGVHAVLSSALDHDVRLVALPADPKAHRMSWRERVAAARGLTTDLGIRADEQLPKLSDMDPRALLTLTRNATPPGSFVDLCPVHLLTESSLATVGRESDCEVPNARRFRPNILVADAPEGLPEAEWAGSTVALGDSARLHVVMKTVRCVVPSRQHDGLPLEKGLTRAVATVGGRYLGAYADIARTGRITVGDPIRVTGPREPGRLGKAAATARTATLDTLNRLAELPRRGRHPVG